MDEKEVTLYLVRTAFTAGWNARDNASPAYRNLQAHWMQFCKDHGIQATDFD